MSELKFITCKICNNVWSDNLEYCPNCNLSLRSENLSLSELVCRPNSPLNLDNNKDFEKEVEGELIWSLHTIGIRMAKFTYKRKGANIKAKAYLRLQLMGEEELMLTTEGIYLKKIFIPVDKVEFIHLQSGPYDSRVIFIKEKNSEDIIQIGFYEKMKMTFSDKNLTEMIIRGRIIIDDLWDKLSSIIPNDRQYKNIENIDEKLEFYKKARFLVYFLAFLLSLMLIYFV